MFVKILNPGNSWNLYPEVQFFKIFKNIKKSQYNKYVKDNKIPDYYLEYKNCKMKVLEISTNYPYGKVFFGEVYCIDGVKRFLMVNEHGLEKDKNGNIIQIGSIPEELFQL